MSYFTIFILAIGLSVDSFAVSITSGLNLPHIRFIQAVRMAFVLAVFQAGMPVIGWLFGSMLNKYIEPIDHWVAFVLLSIIGGKMIYESLSNKDEKKLKNPMDLKVLLLLAFATSIDALAVGFSFSIYLKKILDAIIIIGFITFMSAMTGIFIGKKTGSKINTYAEILGGLILLGLGCKILAEHITTP